MLYRLPSHAFCAPPPALKPPHCVSTRYLGAVCALGVVIIGAHAHVQKNVMTDPECVPPEIGQPKSKTATSMGLRVSRWSMSENKSSRYQSFWLDVSCRFVRFDFFGLYPIIRLPVEFIVQCFAVCRVGTGIWW